MDLRHEVRGDYLHVTVGGPFDTLVARRALGQIIHLCLEAGVARALIDARGITTPVSIADRYDLATALAASAGTRVRVAILVSPDNYFSKTLEDTAANRGASVRTTDSPEEAAAFLGISGF